jgi:ribosome-associated protein
MPVRKKAVSSAPKKKTAVLEAGGETVPVRKVARKKKVAAENAGDVFEGEALAREALRFADDKKAENAILLDVRGLSPVTDFLVICDGSSTPHLRAIQNEITGRMKQERGVRAYASHGTPDSGWMLIDFGDVVVHIFHAEKREFYGLEDMWNDAPRLTL